MSGDVVRKEDVIFAFDLDGTIANYGCPVEWGTAQHLNELGEIHIISGGTQHDVENATMELNKKVIHALRSWRGNCHIDMAAMLEITKKGFLKTAKYQKIRKELCLKLRECFHPDIYIGGRSTIDIMPIRNKGDIIKKLQGNGKKVIYFYDCKWSMNDEINNDVPAIKEAWKSIRTDYNTIVKDLNACLKTLS